MTTCVPGLETAALFWREFSFQLVAPAGARGWLAE